MWDIIVKVWFLVVILPFLIASEGYDKLKKFLEKNNYKVDWLYVMLGFLVFILVVLVLGGYR